MTSEKKRVLITVKTYPHPSKKMKETVCTAGITDDGQWIRLYPIPYRYLAEPTSFHIFDWIDVMATKRPPQKDRRPESYAVDCSSIRKVRYLDSKKDALERYEYIRKKEKDSLETVLDEHEKMGTSLSAIRPKKMIGLEIEADAPDWTEEQKTQLNQISFLDGETNPKPLRKVPYKIYCRFECNNPSCKGHRMLLTSWEYNWTFLKLLDEYNQNEKAALEELNKRWMNNFSNTRLGYLIFGTVHAMERFHTFIVIGHCSFKKIDVDRGKQMCLF
ncbi:MAG: hypothetical protein J6M56_11215 [Clostridia bacterium]|nr:hypothetical protein [Clostridia bacterium]